MKTFIFILILYLSGSLLMSLAQNKSAVLNDENIIRKLIDQENSGKIVPSFTQNRILVTGLYPRPNIGVLSTDQTNKEESLPERGKTVSKKRTILRLVVSTAGDIAYEFGNYSIAKKSKSPTASSAGSYLRTWKKVNSKWLIDVLVERPN